MKLAAFVLAWAACSSAGAGQAVVHPAGPSVPENLLRIEIELPSALRALPDMSQVKLLDGNGREIREAFLDLPLPSPDGRRVSLLLHPGRVKSGTAANLVLGRALQPGSEVTLVIAPLSVRKTWQVTGFDGERPSPARWTFATPAAGTREPLRVQFDRPLSLVATSWVAVRAADGRRVAGQAVLEGGDAAWRFTPSQPWHAGPHTLLAHPQLETPAGNRLCAAFEQVAASRAECDAGTEIAFEVRR